LYMISQTHILLYCLNSSMGHWYSGWQDNRLETTDVTVFYLRGLVIGG